MYQKAQGPKVTPSNYFSKENRIHYMGVSQFKSFLECEAAGLAQVRGEYSPFKPDAMVFGSAVHSWNQHGNLYSFKQEHPELYKKDGNMYAEYAGSKSSSGIQDCIDALKDDELCTIALEGEKEVIMTAELFGVPWKIMIDSYNPSHGMFSDLKTMKSLYDRFWSKENGCYVNFVENYGYDIQMAVYSEVERLAAGRDERLDPHIVAVTKELPPDKAILKGFLPIVDKMLSYVQIHLPRVMDVKEGRAEPIPCNKCAYCRSVKKAQIIDYHELLV